jgi:uncharacterized membrane protein
MTSALSSRQKFAAVAATAVAFSALDAIWLGYVGIGFYQEAIGAIMAQPIRWSAAIPFYFLYLAGTLYFVVLPNAARGIARTASQGALFGLVAYGTYDLTNLATLQAFTWKLAAIDMTWGTVATALASAAGAAAANALRRP